MKSYLLALDQGTTLSRAVLFNENMEVVSVDTLDMPNIHPQLGWVEIDPYEILSSQTAVLTSVLRDSQIFADEIAAIGITNQRETTLVWERESGRPIYNAIGWQCRRTMSATEELYAKGHDTMIQEKTGLKPDAYFSATKIRWILDNVKGAQKRAEKGELCFGTVDTWLLWNFTKGKSYLTDYSNASRTMLYNIHTLKWDKDLLKLFNIPEEMLPEVVPSDSFFGNFHIAGVDIPIGGVIGDQQASLFGQACFKKGDTKNTYGTGCFLLRNTGTKPVNSKNGLLTTIAYGLGKDVFYALEGSIFHAGSVSQWLRDKMQMIESSKDMGRISASIEDTGGMYLVPAFTGLGTPHWNMRARGTTVGMTQTTTKEHFIRAAEESIAYQVKDVVLAMEADTKTSITSLKVDGGASQDTFLMQFQSDILHMDIRKGTVSETTALGAAFLAGLHIGWWKDVKDIEEAWVEGSRFAPKMKTDTRDELYDGWLRAVERSKDWSKL